MAGVKNVHGLTDKEEKFAQAVAKGSTLTDAFKSCYSWENYTPDSNVEKSLSHQQQGRCEEED